MEAGQASAPRAKTAWIDRLYYSKAALRTAWLNEPEPEPEAQIETRALTTAPHRRTGPDPMSAIGNGADGCHRNGGSRGAALTAVLVAHSQ